MKLEDSYFAQHYDLNTPEWQGEAYKAFRRETLVGDGFEVIVLPLSNEYPIFPSMFGGIMYGAFLIGNELVRQSHGALRFELHYHGMDNSDKYPVIVIQLRDAHWSQR